MSGAEGELDEAGGEAWGEQTETAESQLWRQIEALNGLRTAGCSAAACKATAQVASPGALTCQILGLDHSHAERCTRSYTPHERAALSAAQRRNVSENHTVCLCACCGDTRVFGVELGRAQSFQDLSCAMYGANRFINHEVSLSVLMAEAYMDEHGWSAAVTIPKCVPPVCLRGGVSGQCGKERGGGALRLASGARLELCSKTCHCKRAAPTVLLKLVCRRASIEDYRNGGQNFNKLNFPFTRVTCSGVGEDERHELPTAP